MNLAEARELQGHHDQKNKEKQDSLVAKQKSNRESELKRFRTAKKGVESDLERIVQGVYEKEWDKLLKAAIEKDRAQIQIQFSVMYESDNGIYEEPWRSPNIQGYLESVLTRPANKVADFSLVESYLPTRKPEQLTSEADLPKYETPENQWKLTQHRGKPVFQSRYEPSDGNYALGGGVSGTALGMMCFLGRLGARLKQEGYDVATKYNVDYYTNMNMTEPASSHSTAYFTLQVSGWR